MKRKYKPAGLRFVGSQEAVTKKRPFLIHIVRKSLLKKKASKTACGKGEFSAYMFPFHQFIWRNKEAPICKECKEIVSGNLNEIDW